MEFIVNFVYFSIFDPRTYDVIIRDVRNSPKTRRHFFLCSLYPFSRFPVRKPLYIKVHGQPPWEPRVHVYLMKRI